jgi:hypothetical protein
MNAHVSSILLGVRDNGPVQVVLHGGSRLEWPARYLGTRRPGTGTNPSTVLTDMCARG